MKDQKAQLDEANALVTELRHQLDAKICEASQLRRDLTDLRKTLGEFKIKLFDAELALARKEGYIARVNEQDNEVSEIVDVSRSERPHVVTKRSLAQPELRDYRDAGGVFTSRMLGEGSLKEHWINR